MKSENNHNGSNNKSYIVVAIAAVIMLLAVFLVKNIFSIDSERLLVSEDVTTSNMQSEQEAISKTLSTVQGDDLPDKEQQSLSGKNEDISQEAGQESLLPESTDEEPAQSQETLPLDEQPEVQTQQDIHTEEIVLQAVQETSGKTYKFRKAQYLTEHFQKHGDEFPYTTEEEYLQGANNVINNPDALHKLEAEDGDDVYYVENTNEFVVVSTDGYIRTYFKASIDYYNRQ